MGVSMQRFATKHLCATGNLAKESRIVLSGLAQLHSRTARCLKGIVSHCCHGRVGNWKELERRGGTEIDGYARQPPASAMVFRHRSQ